MGEYTFIYNSTRTSWTQEVDVLTKRLTQRSSRLSRSQRDASAAVRCLETVAQASQSTVEAIQPCRQQSRTRRRQHNAPQWCMQHELRRPMNNSQLKDSPVCLVLTQTAKLRIPRSSSNSPTNPYLRAIRRQTRQTWSQRPKRRTRAEGGEVCFRECVSDLQHGHGKFCVRHDAKLLRGGARRRFPTGRRRWHSRVSHWCHVRKRVVTESRSQKSRLFRASWSAT